MTLLPIQKICKKQLDLKFEKLPQLIKAIEEKVNMTNAFLTYQYERNNTSPNAQPNKNLLKLLLTNFSFTAQQWNFMDYREIILLTRTKQALL